MRTPGSRVCNKLHTLRRGFLGGAVGEGVQNSFFTPGNNYYDVSMSNYRRAKFCGGYYFFTVVSYKRREILAGEPARRHLRHAFEKVRSKRPFKTIALCLLPEHLHCIWKLPEGDGDCSTRWSFIKRDFTGNYL